MNTFIKKFKSEKGAIDKVLVTLLLIVVAISSIVAIELWFSEQKDDLINLSNDKIDVVKSNSGSY